MPEFPPNNPENLPVPQASASPAEHTGSGSDGGSTLPEKSTSSGPSVEDVFGLIDEICPQYRIAIEQGLKKGNGAQRRRWKLVGDRVARFYRKHPFRPEKPEQFLLLSSIVSFLTAAGSAYATSTTWASDVYRHCAIAILIFCWPLLVSWFLVHHVTLRKLLKKIGVVALEIPVSRDRDLLGTTRPVRIDAIGEQTRRWKFLGATGVNVFGDAEKQICKKELAIDVIFSSLHPCAFGSIYQVRQLQKKTKNTRHDITGTYERVREVEQAREEDHGHPGLKIDTSPLIHFPFFRVVVVDNTMYVRGYTEEDTPNSEHLVIQGPGPGEAPSFLFEMFMKYVDHEVRQSSYERATLASMYSLSSSLERGFDYETLKKCGEDLGVRLPGEVDAVCKKGFEEQYQGLQGLLKAAKDKSYLPPTVFGPESEDK